MYRLQGKWTRHLPVIVFCTVFSALAMAESDMQLQERVLKAREQQNMDHSAHADAKDETMGFRGVFYGYLPCQDCSGIKMSLSLKQHDNYLLVTQNAKESSREYFEKGKYTWDDKNSQLLLTPSKQGAEVRRFRIENEGTLIQLNGDGTPMAGKQDDYALRRSDMAKSRQVHIH